MVIKKYLIEISVVFLLLPIIIFFLGFLKPYISLPLSVLVIFICYKSFKKKPEDVKENSNKRAIIYYILVSILILVWLGFSGIGNFSFQNDDWDVRNAVMRDLTNYDWPVHYSLNTVDEQSGQDVATETVGFVYYFCYWLPAAIFGKLFGLTAGNIFLFIWTFIALMLTVLLINKKINKNSIWAVLVLIFFSGLDILLINDKLFSSEIMQNIFTENHLEYAGANLQYSSNTTQLYWVFNQSVMTWLIIALIIQIKKPETIIFISCLTFCYSPFATFGVLPIAIFLIIKCLVEENKISKFSSVKQFLLKIGKILISWESLFALCILIIFGTFYTSSTSTITLRNFNWITNGITFVEFLGPYLRFILVNALVYEIVLFWKYKKDPFFWFIVIELLLIPLYRMTPANDFCMRASIGPLFVLTIFVIEFLADNKNKILILIMLFLLVIGMATPVHEILRSIHHTFSDDRKDYIKDNLIYSIGNPISDYGKRLCGAQFYAHDLDEKIFFKYFSK